MHNRVIDNRCGGHNDWTHTILQRDTKVCSDLSAHWLRATLALYSNYMSYLLSLRSPGTQWPLPQIQSVKCNYCSAGAEYKVLIVPALCLINLSALQIISGLCGKLLNWLRETCLLWRRDRPNKHLSHQNTSEYLLIFCRRGGAVSGNALYVSGVHTLHCRVGSELSPDW